MIKKGDYLNPAGILDVLERLPPNHLNLVFIDPTDCGIPFSTVEQVINCLGGERFTRGGVDIIVNVAVGSDANRNLAEAVRHPETNMWRKYSDFLGSPTILSDRDARFFAEHNKHDKLRQLFIDFYISKLKGVGLQYVSAFPVKNYYYLVYATKSPRGIDFWEKANRRDPNGQITMDEILNPE